MDGIVKSSVDRVGIEKRLAIQIRQKFTRRGRTRVVAMRTGNGVVLYVVIGLGR